MRPTYATRYDVAIVQAICAAAVLCCTIIGAALVACTYLSH